MTETEERPKKKKPAKPKRGLHGWKAALAVVGCGTLAAFGIFGLMFLSLSLLLGTASSGIADSDDPGVAVEQTGSPREELDAGGLNICSDYLPMISDINIKETISAEHSDDALEENFDEGDRRVVSGDCSFTVIPDYGVAENWFFDIDYEVIIHDPENDSDQQAGQEFQRRVSDAEDYFSSIQSQGGFGGPDEGKFFYGVSVEDVDQYVVVARTRSAVYTVTFLADADSAEGAEVPENNFSRQADQLLHRLNDRFFKNIPE